MRKIFWARIVTFLLCLPALGMTSMGASAVTYDCLIEPTQIVEVRSPVTGMLEKVHVRRGDRVAKGQVVATLESGAEQAAAELARAKSEMVGPGKAADSKLEFSKRKYQRRRDMHADKLMSGQERDEAEAEMRLAEAEIQLTRENKEIARYEWTQQTSLLKLRTLRSPFNGIVVDQMAYPGEVVQPSDPKKYIVKLAQLDPLRVRVVLPFAQFGKVKPGMHATVSPEAPVGGQVTAKVMAVDRLVDAASGTFIVLLEVPNANVDIPSGIKCRAELLKVK